MNESDLLLIFFQVGLKIKYFMSVPLDFHPLNLLVLLGIKMFDLNSVRNFVILAVMNVRLCVMSQ